MGCHAVCNKQNNAPACNTRALNAGARACTRGRILQMGWHAVCVADERKSIRRLTIPMFVQVLRGEVVVLFKRHLRV